MTEVTASKKCPDCGTEFRDHMLKTSCHVSGCKATPYCRKLDESLKDVPFPVRAAICSGFYMSLVRPAAQRGNVVWEDRNFTQIISHFCDEIESARINSPETLAALAAEITAGTYEVVQSHEGKIATS